MNEARSGGGPRTSPITVMVVLGALLALPGFALHAGGFNPEVLISGGGGLASDPTLAADPVNNIFLVWTEDGDLRVSAGIDLSGGGTPITSGGLEHTAPHVYVSPTATATVVFEREVASPGTETDIFYLTSPFGTPVALGVAAAGEHLPKVDGASGSGERHAVWERDDGGSNTIMIGFDLGGAEEVAVGNDPAVATASNGDVFVVYERNGDIFMATGDAGGLTETPLSADPEVELRPRVAVDPNGIPHVVFARAGDIIYVRGDGSGGLLPPVTVPDGGGDAGNAEVRATGGGTVHIVFLEGDDVWHTSGSATVFLPAENVTQSPGVVESDPTFDVDSLGYFHIAYGRDGEVYYRNDAPPPVASFSVDPTMGEQPLPVQFTNTSSGVITSFEWDFGDGVTSNEENPAHLYETTGTYGVFLTVRGPGGESALFQPNLVQVISPSNVMRVPSITVFQGQSNVDLPVLGTHPDPAQGYQVSMGWDTGVLDFVESTVEFTDVEDLNPEFFATNIDLSGPFANLTLGVILDINPPFDGRTLAPGVDQRLVNLIFDIGITAPVGDTIVDLEHGLGDPPVVNLFTINAFSVIPALEDGVVNVLPFVFPPPVVFIRGDVDSSSTANLVDAVYILAFLFQSGPDPVCIDAADVDDEGSIGIADAITLLTFIFGGGQVIPIPYPSPGLDPTPDALGDC